MRGKAWVFEKVTGFFDDCSLSDQVDGRIRLLQQRRHNPAPAQNIVERQRTAIKRAVDPPGMAKALCGYSGPS